MNNLRQMMLGWRLYADDFNDLLVASLPVPDTKRPVWVTGGLGYGGGPSDWDPQVDLAKVRSIRISGRTLQFGNAQPTKFSSGWLEHGAACAK
jgi:hypothetical protein